MNNASRGTIIVLDSVEYYLVNNLLKANKCNSFDIKAGIKCL